MTPFLQKDEVFRGRTNVATGTPMPLRPYAPLRKGRHVDVYSRGGGFPALYIGGRQISKRTLEAGATPVPKGIRWARFMDPLYIEIAKTPHSLSSVVSLICCSAKKDRMSMTAGWRINVSIANLEKCAKSAT